MAAERGSSALVSRVVSSTSAASTESESSSSMRRPSKRTARGSGLKRDPPHVSHGVVTMRLALPRPTSRVISPAPSQGSHWPWRVLNEKKRGSSSG
jgi:hypothetical protein